MTLCKSILFLAMERYLVMIHETKMLIDVFFFFSFLSKFVMPHSSSTTVQLFKSMGLETHTQVCKMIDVFVLH